MSPTLLEGAIAIVLAYIAWRIGSFLAPRIIRRFRERHPREKSADRKNKPPYIIDT